jgi:dTDP-4-dehydrorhamnose 3,5-epimerase
MRLEEAPIGGAFVIELDPIADERGWFARTYDEEEFRASGLDPVGVQCNTSLNPRRATIRGLHYQAPPHAEAKLIRCVRGAIWDVGVDLRPGSSTYMSWHALELSAENRRGFYLPAGLAHGFQTLTDDCEVQYTMSRPYAPDAAAGVRWDDPAFGIDWPDPGCLRTISDRDRDFPDFAS